MSEYKVTTLSGAVYHISGDKVTGGSKGLKDGRLLRPVSLGAPLLISAPERGHLHPEFRMPGVTSTDVVSIELEEA